MQASGDLGNGMYRNPILAGDYADPSVVRVGDDYYMTHSNFKFAPGLLIWHSKDLVNWEPIAKALTDYAGDVWAPDLTYYKDRFYIYAPINEEIMVLTATHPHGPWSDPQKVGVQGIDPGHVADSNGNRYLFFSDGYMVELAGDGLSAVGTPRKVYDGWPFPKEWVVEGNFMESPKLTFHNGYFYLTVAQGGTSGPSTSHMVASARSKEPWGPYEHSPTIRLFERKAGMNDGALKGTVHWLTPRTAVGGSFITRTKKDTTHSAGKRCSNRWNGRRTDGSASRFIARQMSLFQNRREMPFPMA